MRDIVTLLNIVKDNINSIEQCKGVCVMLIVLSHHNIITTEEHILLQETITVNKPANVVTAYYFMPTEVEPRLKFINSLIDKYKHLNQ